MWQDVNYQNRNIFIMLSTLYFKQSKNLEEVKDIQQNYNRQKHQLNSIFHVVFVLIIQHFKNINQFNIFYPNLMNMLQLLINIVKVIGYEINLLMFSFSKNIIYNLYLLVTYHSLVVEDIVQLLNFLFKDINHDYDKHLNIEVYFVERLLTLTYFLFMILFKMMILIILLKMLFQLKAEMIQLLLYVPYSTYSTQLIL